MTVHKTSLPFNKDTATVSQLKAAAESIEMLFNAIERIEHSTELGHIDTDDVDNRLAGLLRSIYADWVKKYPKKD